MRGKKMNEIEEKSLRMHKANESIKRLALMGSLGTGKSTIFQNIRKTYHWQEDCAEDSIYINVIRKQCYANALTLSLCMEDTKYYLQLKQLSIDEPDHLKEIADIIANIWSDKKIRFLYSNRNILLLPDWIKIDDNMEYYFDNIHDTLAIDYNPDFKAHLYVHDRDSHFEEFVAEIKDTFIHVIDVPSKFVCDITKRLYMFEGLDAILYVVDLSKYCKPGALEEDLDNFYYIVKSRWFKSKPMGMGCEIILVLNKNDIFRQQLAMGLPFAEFKSKHYQEKLNEQEFLSNSLNNRSIFEMMAVTGYLRDVCKKQSGLMDQIVPLDIIHLIEAFVMDDGEIYDEKVYKYALNFIQDLYKEAEAVSQRRIFIQISNGLDEKLVEKIFWDIQNIVIRRGS